jgi:hypothetical protein
MLKKSKPYFDGIEIIRVSISGQGLSIEKRTFVVVSVIFLKSEGKMIELGLNRLYTIVWPAAQVATSNPEPILFVKAAPLYCDSL